MPIATEQEEMIGAVRTAVDRQIKESRRRRISVKPILERPTTPPTPWQQPTEGYTPTVIPQEQVPWIPQRGVTPAEVPTQAPILTTEAYKPTPWYRKGMEIAFKPFELLHKYVEVPGAAAITAPWTPTLPAKEGETWLEREKREYEAWKAPKFVKGITEFAISLPLFMIPYGGWGFASGKLVARAARFAGLVKSAGAIEKGAQVFAEIVPKIERIVNYPIVKPLEMVGGVVKKAITETIPITEKGIEIGIFKLNSIEKMASEVVNQTHITRLAERWSKIPGFEWFIRKIDPSIVARTPEMKYTVAYGRLLDAGESLANAQMYPLLAQATPKEVKALMGIDDLGWWTKVKPKPEFVNAPIDGASIIARPSQYALTPEQEVWVNMFNATWKPVEQALKGKQILLRQIARDEDGGYLGRLVTQVVDPATGKTMDLNQFGRGKAIGAKFKGALPRIFENHTDLVNAGYRVETDPLKVMSVRMRQGLKAMVDQDFIDTVGALGREIGAKALPARIARDEAQRQVTNTKFVLDRLRRVSRGEKLTPASLKAIRNKNEEIADMLGGKPRIPEITIPKAPVTPEVTGKQLWQMTRDEFTRKGLTPELRELYNHPARIKGLSRASYEETADFLDKLRNLVSKRMPKRLKEVDEMIELAANDEFVDAAIVGEQVLGRLHMEDQGLFEAIGKIGEEAVEIATRQAEKEHTAILRKAISEGKPVPAEVLIDYPDLAKAIPKAPVTPEVTITLRPVVAGSPEILGDISKGGKVVGWFAGRTTKDEFRIALLNIKSPGTVNRQFIGDFLSSIEEEAKSRGLKSVVAVDPSNIPVYKSLGFVESGKGEFRKSIEIAIPKASVIPKVEVISQRPLVIDTKDIKGAIRKLNNQLLQERNLATQAREKASRILEATRRPSVNEGTVYQPGFGGRIFPKETAEYLNRTLDVRVDQWAKWMATPSGFIRFAQTGVDLGPYMLQGLPTLFSNPKVWGQTVKNSLPILFDEKTIYQTLARPDMQELLSKVIPHGFVLNVAEMVEAAPIFAKIPIAGGFFNRWAKWFNGAIDLGRLNQIDALLKLPSFRAAGDAGVRAAVDHVGKTWGVMSTRWLGVPEAQRQVENAVLFYASRWTRSGFALMKDAFTRGGMEGALARDVVGKMILGMTTMYYGFSKALGQEPNFDPSSGKFMTIQVGTDHVGFGGMYIALARFAGNVARTLSENPEGFVKLDTRDNPFLQFIRGRVAPVTGMGWDIIDGKTYIGEPVDSFPNFAKNVALPHLVPFWIQGVAQSLVGEQPMPSVGAIPAEFLGFRTWPLRTWERRDDLREQYAQTDSGKSWQELTVLDRRKLETAHTDLKEMSQEAWRESITKGRPSRIAYGAWREERDAVNEQYEQGLWDLQRQVDEGIKIPYDFRLSAQDLGKARRFALKHIDTKPEYKDVIIALNEPRTEPEMSPQFEDIAYDKYMELMFAGDLELGIDEYDWAEADRRKQEFIQVFGQKAYDYVQEKLRFGKNIPPLMQEYYKAIDIMREYWEVRDYWVEKFGEPKTQSALNRMNAFVSRQHERLRKTSPDIAKYYSLFYKRTPTLATY